MIKRFKHPRDILVVCTPDLDLPLVICSKNSDNTVSNVIQTDELQKKKTLI